MSPRLISLAIGLAGLLAIALILRHSSNTLPSLGSDQFAYVIYMGIWAALIGAAVISRPGGLGHSLKQFVIWIGIFLVVMAAYSYRYELQDIASRMSAGLVPPSPISINNVPGQQQITIIRDNNGHFSTRGKVNDAPIRFLIDTGATDVVLTHQDAVRAGIDVDTLHYNIPVSTANGMTTSARTRINLISIGPITIERLRVMVSRKDDLRESLLGMRFINNLQSFEIRGDRMILTR